MQPITNTLYSVGLFLALIALSSWTKRRQTRPERYQ